MELETSTVATFSQTQTLLLRHYRESTVEFWWEEKTDLALSFLHHCIILECILLNFDSLRLHLAIQNRSKNKPELTIRKEVCEHVLVANARVTFRQRFAKFQFLLVADSNFPNPNSTSPLSQTYITERANKDLMRLPEAIVIGTDIRILKLVDPASRSIISMVTTSIIIFVEFSTNSVRIGCFSCHDHNHLYKHNWDSIVYPVDVMDIPKTSISSLRNVKKYWQQLHGYLHFQKENGIQNCLKINSYKITSKYEGEACETYELFFRYSNCSNFELCIYFKVYKLGLSPLTPSYVLVEHRLPQVIAYGQNESEFTFQVLLPKAHFFDTNLSAFLMPFNDMVWICMIVAIVTILNWLIFIEKWNAMEALFWVFSVIMENDVDLLRKARFGGKIFLLQWILGGILLRNFYNSSLYSLMTAEHERKDFPRDIDELLNNYSDLVLIGTESFLSESRLFLQNTSKLVIKSLSPEIANLTSTVFHKSVFINGGLNHNNLQNVANGKEIAVTSFSKDSTKIDSKIYLLTWSKKMDTNQTYTKFAVMCEGDCESNWNAALFGQTGFDRIVPKQQRPFFKSIRFWFYGKNRFATSQFEKFFRGFVESGLFKLSTSRYRKLQRINVIRGQDGFQAMGISNGSLFSYVFLAQGIDEINEIKPAKIPAFVGTFLITGGMLGLATAVLVLEILRKLLVKVFTMLCSLIGK
ncbi:unnamed protein product [Orchesella dallaii]|uniref:Uncharacterized protein n=1 Tax=Orchesella dallaii TaxID=48710 RepID=A0ABP1S4R1_9HEXA